MNRHDKHRADDAHVLNLLTVLRRNGTHEVVLLSGFDSTEANSPADKKSHPCVVCMLGMSGIDNKTKAWDNMATQQIRRKSCQ